MKKNSILFTINLTFFISFIFLSVGFAVLYDMYEKREHFFIHKRNEDVSHMFLREHIHQKDLSKLRQELQQFNFSLIDNKTEINKIMHDKNRKIRHAEPNRRVKIHEIELNNNLYVYIATKHFEVILKNNEPLSNHLFIASLLYLIIVGGFAFLYFSIINKLKPLKQLTKVVENLGNEEFDVTLSSNNTDEISQLINEFSNSAKKLKSLKESRNIFIRNIMHELKTPITKGKFLLHLAQNEENQEKMEKVFYRLEALIKEFATIEELISTKKQLIKKEYFLEDIVDNAIDLLMCTEDEIQKEFQNLRIAVDFDLFSIAVKNLLDNGIKYSTNKQVNIQTTHNSIVFVNIGEKLTYPLESYYEPFFRGDDVKSNQSFGLGLYIVKNILDAHNMQLTYNYIDGVNQFHIKYT
ncbi:ArsS family sensor histidine kinase [Sulfurimonas sp.]|uniref:ArsS family sensor histidine kinase n=1 Tax=Sulfurimonas sp. TaxID=2022749 RepID=UPI003D0D2F2E